MTVDQPTRVVVDANVLVENFRPSNAFKLLLEGSRTGQLVLVVPDLAIKEAANKFRERAWERINGIDQAVAKVRALGIEPGSEHDLEPDAEAIRYEYSLRRGLSDVHAVVPPLPDVAHDAVVQRALDRRKPFDPEGDSGYRDALMWESVLDQARSHGSVVFCTRDRKGFADPDKPTTLAPDLLVDLTGPGLAADSIFLELDYRALVARLVDVERVAIDEVERALLRLGPDLEHAVEVALSDFEFDHGALADIAVDRFDFRLGADRPDRVTVRDAHLAGASNLSHAAVEEARVLTDDEILVSLYIEIDSDLDLDMEMIGRDGWESDPWRTSRTVAVSRTLAVSAEGTYLRSEEAIIGLSVYSARVL